MEHKNERRVELLVQNIGKIYQQMKTLDQHNRERKEKIKKLGLEAVKENPGVLCPKCRAEMYYLIPGLWFFQAGSNLPQTQVRCSKCMYEDSMIV